MIKRLLLGLLLAVTPALAQTYPTYKGSWESGTYANIPAAPACGRLYLVTDAPAKSNCGAGGGDGSTPAYCRWTDTNANAVCDTWVAIGTTGSGAGDVTGPGSSTDNCIVRFNGVAGTAIQEGTDCPTYDDSGSLTSTSAFFKGRPVFDVRAYGAVGDNSTDDRAAIQSAIDAAEAAVSVAASTSKAAAVVFLTHGTYIINGPLLIQGEHL